MSQEQSNEDEAMETMLELMVDQLLSKYPNLNELPRDQVFLIYASAFITGIQYGKDDIVKEVTEAVVQKLKEQGRLLEEDEE